MATISFDIRDAQGLQDGVMRPDAVVLTASALPALSGSDKQVAWADKLRADAINGVAAAMTATLRLARAAQTFDLAKMRAGGEAQMPKLATALDGRTSAAWWIDNRDALAAKPAYTIVAG